MILLYIAASAFVGVVIAAAAGRYAWVVGVVITLVALGPVVALVAYDRVIGIQGDPSAYGLGATLAFVLLMPAGIAALATAWIRA